MRTAVALLIVLPVLAACASTPRPDYSGDPNFRKAHLACHQQMMGATGGIGWGITPNRHLYLMCMKDKGYDV
jgi:hypothetical protein